MWHLPMKRYVSLIKGNLSLFPQILQRLKETLTVGYLF